MSLYLRCYILTALGLIATVAATCAPQSRLTLADDLRIAELLPAAAYGINIDDFFLDQTSDRVFLSLQYSIPPPPNTPAEQWRDYFHWEAFVLGRKQFAVLGRYPLRFDSTDVYSSRFTGIAGLDADGTGAILSSGYQLVHWNYRTGEVRTLWAQQDTEYFTHVLHRAAVTDDGRYAAVVFEEVNRRGGKGGTIPRGWQFQLVVIDVTTGANLRSCFLGSAFSAGPPVFPPIALSEDAKLFFHHTVRSELEDGFAVVDTTTCQQLRRWKFPEPPLEGVFLDAGRALAVSFDGGMSGKRIRLMDVASGSTLREVHSPPGMFTLTTLSLAPDRRALLFPITVANRWFWELPGESHHYTACGLDIVDLPTGKRVATIRPPGMALKSCPFDWNMNAKFTRDGRFAALVSNNGIQLYSVPASLLSTRP